MFCAFAAFAGFLVVSSFAACVLSVRGDDARFCERRHHMKLNVIVQFLVQFVYVLITPVFLLKHWRRITDRSTDCFVGLLYAFFLVYCTLSVLTSWIAAANDPPLYQQQQNYLPSAPASFGMRFHSSIYSDQFIVRNFSVTPAGTPCRTHAAGPLSDDDGGGDDASDAARNVVGAPVAVWKRDWAVENAAAAAAPTCIVVEKRFTTCRDLYQSTRTCGFSSIGAWVPVAVFARTQCPQWHRNLVSVYAVHRTWILVETVILGAIVCATAWACVRECARKRSPTVP